MEHKLKAVAVVLLIGVGLLIGQQLDRYKTEVEVKQIEIQDTTSELQQLKLDYIQLNKNLDSATESAETTQDKLEALREERQRLEREKQRLEVELQAKARRKAEQSGRNIAYADKPTTVKVVGNKQAWLAASNIPRSDWQYADYIIQKESGWRYDVWNGSGSSAYGLCQTMTSIHKPPQSFYSDPVEQLNWCNNYAQKYGGWAGSYSFWLDNHWW